MIRKLLVVLAGASLLASAASQSSAERAQPPANSFRSASLAVEVEPLPPGARLETVISARDPTAMAFAPNGQWYYTERTSGWVRYNDSSSLAFPLYHAPALSSPNSEQGLLGIALDPNFAANGHIYIYYTSGEDFQATGKYDNRVVRITDKIGQPISPTTLLKVPLESNATTIHNGGNLHFGPDGKLYVSIGDYFNDANGQNLTKMPAKIHRFNLTAPLTAPADNPFFDGAGPNADSTYAFGFRNPFDFDFDPVSGRLFAGDNGVACDDEVNLVLPGYNYGWRSSYPACDDFSPGGPDPNFNTLPPLIAWSYSVAPTGVTFYRGDLFPEWKNDLFVCHWKTGELHHFKLNAARDTIVAHSILSNPAGGTTLCHLDVETGSDGALYFFRNVVDDPNKEFRDILRITRDATVYASTFNATPSLPAPGDALTYTMRLVHYGTLTTTYSITSSLPASTTLLGGSPQATGGSIVGSSAGITWTGSILPNTTLTATYRLAVSDQIVAPTPLTSEMRITTDQADPVARTSVVIVNGFALYLPLVARLLIH